MLLLFENDGRRDIFRQEKSPNSSYHQSKYCSKVNWKDFYDRYCTSAFHFNVNCHLSFISSMTSVLSMIFLVFQRSSLFLREEHKLSSEITFLNMIEWSDIEWKSLLWICLALTRTCLNSFFHILKLYLIAFSTFVIIFLNSGWNSSVNSFTPTP